MSGYGGVFYGAIIRLARPVWLAENFALTSNGG